MKYNTKLKTFFKQKGISNKELAHKLDYSETMVGRYLNGRNEMKMQFLLSIIKEFPELDLNYVFKDVAPQTTQ